MAVPDQEIFTPEEIAELLKMHAYSVTEWLRDGKLKGFKANTKWRVWREDLVKFVGGEENGDLGS